MTRVENALHTMSTNAVNVCVLFSVVRKLWSAVKSAALQNCAYRVYDSVFCVLQSGS